MGVRVRVKVRYKDHDLEVVALANTGFESECPEILLPLKVAEILDLWPPPRESITETYVSASGYMRVIRVPGAGIVSVLTEDRISDDVVVDIIISEVTDEVLLNDKLIGKLRIVLEEPGEGLWRFRDETKLRKSERIQKWL